MVEGVDLHFGEARGAEQSRGAVAAPHRAEAKRRPVPATPSLRNDSTAEVHEIVALKLPDGEGRSVDELLQLPESELDVLSRAHRTS